MQTNPPCLLLDTNVWLETFIPNRPHRKDVQELFAEARKHDATLAFSSQTALNVYQKVRKDGKKWSRDQGILDEPMARDCVNEMQSIATAVPTDMGDLYLACKHRDTHDDLEDDLVIAACQKACANYLVTLDRKLLEHAPVKAVTPAQMVGLLRSGKAEGTICAEPGRDYLLEWLRSL